MLNTHKLPLQDYYSLPILPRTREPSIDNISSVNQYSFLDTLGQGAYGQVRLAMKENFNTPFAVKIINRDDLKRKREVIRDEKGRVKYKNALDNLKQEIAIMEQLNHPNIIKLHEVIDDLDSPNIYIVMEYLQGGQLLEWDEASLLFSSPHYKGYLPEEILRGIFSGIIDGLEYLHQNNIVHRDIKPQNILIDEFGRPKITDFGTAVKVKDPNNDIFLKNEGTHYFMPPEAISETSGTRGYSGKSADIWAMGVTFYALTFKRLPFYSRHILELFDKIETQPVEFPEERLVSKELKKLLEGILEKDPRKRLTLEQIKENFWLGKRQDLFKVEDILKKRKESPESQHIVRRAVTIQESSFQWDELCKKDTKHIRRAETLKYEKYNEPNKKIHIS